MVRDKERAINPAAAQRKADKQKALKKGKAAIAAQRTERLAQRNPQRLQTQIDALRERETGAGNLSIRDRKSLEDLEQELSRVLKAKETVGKKHSRHGHAIASSTNSHDLSSGQNVTLGKRGREQKFRVSSDSSETEDDARLIPMPGDTPPPIPVRRPLDGKRHLMVIKGNEANQTSTVSEHVPAQTVYESKPILRDLRKEATSFLPGSVRRNIVSRPNQPSGNQLDSGEINALEQDSKRPIDSAASGVLHGHQGSRTHLVHVEEIEDTGD